MRTVVNSVLVALALVTAAAVAHAGEPGVVFDVRAEFERYDPNYVADRRAARQPLPGLAERVRALETSGSPAIRCAQERLTELWITTHDTADFAKARAETAALEQLLAAVPSLGERGPAAGDDRGYRATPDGPDAEGAWGRCYSQWYLRLDASYDVISERKQALEVPARFLDRVNDPEALTRYLRSLSVSDIAIEGIDHRRELNYSVSALMRLILRDKPIGYKWAPAMKDTIRHLLLDELRDPASGTWGPRYKRDGSIVFVPDVSITFHVVKYLEGNVPEWTKIIDTLLANRDLQYPQGWREGEGYLAHDLYDVATLFHLGWAHADADRQSRMAAALGAMLDWCLEHVVRPDGSVRVDENDNSVETSTYFAVGLLSELGVFGCARRFWTARGVPDGPALGSRMAARIRDALAHGGGAEGGTYYRNALERLASDGVR